MFCWAMRKNGIELMREILSAEPLKSTLSAISL